jgi:uncharacterized membrane protein
MGFIFYLKLYLVTIPIFFAIDLLWLGVLAKEFYRSQLGFILSPQVNWAAAIVFYLLYIAGILIFAVRPAINANSWQQAAIFGALFGLFTYGTYDLTNLATIDNWPIVVVAVDMVWGICLCTLVSILSFAASRWMI